MSAMQDAAGPGGVWDWTSPGGTRTFRGLPSPCRGGSSPSSGSGPASVSCSVGKPEDLKHSTGTWTQLLKNTRRALAHVSPHTLGWAWRGVLGSAWHQDGACAPALLLPQCRAFPRLLFLHFQPSHAVIIIIILIIKLQGVV